MNSHKYFPCMISKDGELNALRRLDMGTKRQMSPIIELVHEGIALDKIVAKLKTHWIFPGNQLLLDYTRFHYPVAGEAEKVIKGLRVAGINVVPVLSFESTPIQRQIAKDHIIKKKLPLGVRISLQKHSSENVKDSINELLQDLGVAEQDAILLLDLGYIQGSEVDHLTQLVVRHITAIADITWRSVVVISGCFPKTLEEFEVSEKPYIIKRHEETVFALVKHSFPIVKYGDYGTKHPNYIPSQHHAGSCSVKYTTRNSFVIYRGTIAKNSRYGNGQYVAHSARLVKTPHYMGESFCWGDKEIKRISKEKMSDARARTGNPATWVAISWSHHMTLMNNLASS